ILEASGHHHVSGATVVQLDEHGHPVHGSERYVGCDLIALSTGFEPAAALIYQSGGKMRYDEAEGTFVPDSLPPSVAAAGSVAGTHDLEAQLLDGQVAGLRAVLDLGLSGDTSRYAHLQAELSRLRQSTPPESSRTLVSVPHHAHKKFVCLCEDLTEKDICDAIHEGFDHIETLKRYSTLSMGPCQGKMCSMASVVLCARQTGRTIAETGTTTSRPPYQPVALGALAGSVHEPVKRTPMHHRHVALGAQMMDMGLWKRPKLYTSAFEEYKAVRERVGLIDVGTLGKLDVKGTDAVFLLDKVYTNGYRTLKPGRVRYGVMCDDAGIILDDGTVTRLSDDHFFITTTTGNIEFVHEWLEWWAAGTDLCVHVTNVTAGYAAVNLAGPRARDLLSTLTDVDLSTSAFPYMAAAQGKVAGIPALMLRIGFVGELGYEMHVPAEYGEALWDALMDAGQPFGIAPFGVETQRILRLEKKHIIVGQDTDALSNPLEADMAWIVKFDKPDFIGKASLLRVQERGLQQKLVGFVIEDGVGVDEGNAVVANDASVGRVTSFRPSPAMGKGVGMAWVPAGMAGEGAPLSIHVPHGVAVAQVYTRPFYDPEGTRLKA
ncbi:MAG: (2Fe-2S)-binding protein, partial [Candidatus Latescibacteria bacterium]|nr:(2Fe-2S)-binding protein [Candidatus Latescibacterota bacterium]